MSDELAIKEMVIYPFVFTLFKRVCLINCMHPTHENV